MPEAQARDYATLPLRVQGLSSRPASLPLVFADSAAYRAGLHRLQRLNAETLCLGHGFWDGVGKQAAVRRGAVARQFLTESSEAAVAAVRAAVEPDPERPFLDVARAALAALRDRYRLELDPQTGLYEPALAHLHAAWREMRGF